MRPSIELVEAFRATADRVEQQSENYNWYAMSSCNCGVLAQEILDINAVTLYNILDSSSYHQTNWSELADQFGRCTVTDLKLTAVYQALLSAGLEQADFEYIEFLGQTSNEAYQNADLVDRRQWDFDTPEVVVSFFRGLANQMESQLVSQVKSKVAQTQTCGA